MLRPLLLLCALVGLAGAQNTQVVDVSSCRVNFYGKTYTKVYVKATNTEWSICFNGYYNATDPKDCVVGPSETGFETRARAVTSTSSTALLSKVPTVKTKPRCVVDIAAPSNSADNSRVSFYTGGSEGIMQLRAYQKSERVWKIFVEGKEVEQIKLPASFRSSQQIFTDITRCRRSGILYQRSTVLETCRLVCNDVGVLGPPCGDLYYCQGNNVCIYQQTCTVTGNTIIDFYGDFETFPDRCTYTLLTDYGGRVVEATFQDQRREDVSLLDSVTLIDQSSSPPERIVLGQGGRVWRDGKLLSVNGTAQAGSVTLSKDQTGVTAMLTFIPHNITIFFDGRTAQISNSGSDATFLGGLCVDSYSMSWAKSSASQTGCDTPHVDTSNSTINCNASTERCNLLQGAPFTACHHVVDPEPYVSACVDTLCKYPTVDGLKCQFLEDYARACSLRNSSLEDWRPAASCSPRKAFCQDQACSPHEFCGEDGGETRCFCRPIWASPYRKAGTFGDQPVCSGDSASLSLYSCLLEDINIKASDLHLNSPTCRGQVDETDGDVSLSFNTSDSCGAVITSDNNKIVYKNTVRTQNSTDIITRQSQFNLLFSCSYSQPDAQSVTFKIRDSSVVKELVAGVWNYTLSLKSYTDAERQQAVKPNTEVMLGQRIWVELLTVGLNPASVAVVTDSCWATGSSSSNDSVRHDLIISGCANPADQTVAVEGNGRGPSNYFSFELFQFTGRTSDVYLHCKVKLCITENNSCVPVCGGIKRRRRSARSGYRKGAEALISMGWTR